MMVIRITRRNDREYQLIPRIRKIKDAQGEFEDDIYIASPKTVVVEYYPKEKYAIVHVCWCQFTEESLRNAIRTLLKLNPGDVEVEKHYSLERMESDSTMH